MISNSWAGSLVGAVIAQSRRMHTRTPLVISILLCGSLLLACGDGMVGDSGDCPSGDCGGYTNPGSGGNTPGDPSDPTDPKNPPQTPPKNPPQTPPKNPPQTPPKDPPKNLPSCTKDADCSAPYVCHVKGGKCVPLSAKDSGTCDPIEGKNCPAGKQCISGVCVDPPGVCKTNDDCPVTYYCKAGVCTYHGSKPACTTNIHCPTGQYCVNGICKTKQTCKIAGVFNRLKGNWRLDSKLKVRDGLKGFTKGLLGVATTMQNLIDGKFTIKGVPSFLTNIIAGALQGMIHKYVPPWGKQVIQALANIDDAIDDTRVISIENLASVGNGQYIGNSTWILVEFEYKGVKVSTNPTNTPALGKITTTSYTAREICGTFYMDKHKVKNHIGKVYRWAIEAIITGVTCSMKNVPCYKSINAMFNDLIKCQQLGAAMGNSNSSIPGLAAAVTAACNSQKSYLVNLLIKELNDLTANLTYMSLKATATIPNNNQLQNGKWYGVLGGGYGKGNFEGTFKGHRVP